MPFVFLDATKSYATNIIKIFLQYFAKIMVLTFATFYVLYLYLQITLWSLEQGGLAGTMTVLGAYLFTLILGVAFIAGSEKIANILFTGTPTMSMGDIVQGARDVRMAGGAAVGAAKLGAKGLGALGKTAQGAVRGGQSAAAWGSGFKQAVQSGRDAVASSTGFTNDAQGQQMAGQAARGAGLSYIGASLKQGFKDLATKAFTGRDAQHYGGGRDGKGLSSMHSFQGVGGKYLDDEGREQGTTTFGRARDAAHNIAKDIGQKAADKLIKPSQKADQSMQKDSDKPNSGAGHSTKSPGS